MFRFLKRFFGSSETDAFGLPPVWSFSDSATKPYPHPDRVDYELDISTWRYRVKETFRNNDPYAESEISYASMEYEVRRSPAGQWEVRLLGRNSSFHDAPEAWEAAPARFLDAWEKVWAERRMNHDRN